MAIHVLDQHTAELIAAGEVVERPASVAKELLENAVDAGATQIRIAIERGGTTLLQVEDNGSGIAAEDIPLAFLRHATSKVQCEKDLEAIGTLGFRGEALASIASVAKVSLLTKTDEDEFASLYSIYGGQEQGLEAAARAKGTTITVEELFYNTPARMKFLKKDATEGGYITEAVTRLALSHPEISFRYTREGKEVFNTPGDGMLESTVWAVLGKEFAKDLAAIDGTSRNYRAHGLVTKPHAARASRAMQFFFVNGRFVKNRTMMAALEQAYRGMMMQGKFPGGVVFLEMPPALVDVNVHPAKTEVRFAFEKEVFEAVYSAVKSALVQAASSHVQFSLGKEPGDGSTIPQDTKATVASVAQPPLAAEQSQPVASQNTFAPSYSASFRTFAGDEGALASISAFAPYTTRTAPAKPEYALSIEPEDIPEPVIAATNSISPAQQPEELQQSITKAEDSSALRYIGEVFKTYILAEADGVLCVLDKHAAHERILYEKLAASHQKGDIQQLLAPVSVLLSAAEKDALLQNTKVLFSAGIEVEDFGGNGVLVRGVPADVIPDSVSELVTEVAQRLTLNSKDADNEKTEWVLHSMACRAAVKAGDTSSSTELLALARQILSGEIPPFCPHGRPVVLEISRKELEKQFGRLG